ncbi:uncharacterized protein METZ01_LOCUS488539, partial [marine metagenome]
MERFNASIGFDRRLLEVDIAGSKAYAKALHRTDLLDAAELAEITVGLEAVLQEFSAPDCLLPDALED